MTLLAALDVSSVLIKSEALTYVRSVDHCD